MGAEDDSFRCTFGFDGALKRYPSKLQRILGFSESDLAAVSVLNLTHPDERDRMREELQKLREGSSASSTLDARWRRRDGGYHWFSWEIRAMPEVQSFLVVGRDIAEAKRLEAAVETLGPESSAPGGSETVLLAEDDPVSRELMAGVLRSHGYAVLEAVDGKEALEIEARHPGTIDLFVTDVVMPRLNAGLAVEAFRKKRSGAKLMFVSAYTSQTELVQRVRLPGSGFLKKPFTAVELLHAVRTALDS